MVPCMGIFGMIFHLGPSKLATASDSWSTARLPSLYSTCIDHNILSAISPAIILSKNSDVSGLKSAESSQNWLKISQKLAKYGKTWLELAKTWLRREGFRFTVKVLRIYT